MFRIRNKPNRKSDTRFDELNIQMRRLVVEVRKNPSLIPQLRAELKKLGKEHLMKTLDLAEAVVDGEA